MKNFTSFLLRVLLSSCIAASALAQTAPDAGALLRQTERDLPPQTPPATVKSPAAAPAQTTQAGAATVTVSRFKFSGNVLLSEAQLDAVVAPFLNQPLTFAQLQQVTSEVAAAYRAQGWLVRAYLPKQEIENGVVTVQIIEAVFGKATIQGAQPERVEASRLIAMVNAAQSSGAPLSAANVDRALLLLDDLPGVSVTGNFIEGKDQGQTDLVLTTLDEALVVGNVSLDNYGSRFTGAERLSANLSVNSPAHLGDLLSANLLNTQGMDYQRLGYSVPIGPGGLRASAYYSQLRYALIGSFAALGSTGTATTAGLSLSYPLVRTQLQNLNLNLSFDDKNLENSANKLTSAYGIRVVNLAMSGNRFDTVGGGGVTSASLSMSSGDVSTTGSFSKLNLNLSRQQTISNSLSMVVAVAVQAADSNLDSSEKIYLGGAGGVRAYPSSEAGGSAGRTFSLELRQRLAQTWTLSGFYDYGRVTVNQNNEITPKANPNQLSLQGYGAALAWQGPRGIDISATVAQRIGRNPLANSTTGMDTDGTRQSPRFWLSARFSF